MPKNNPFAAFTSLFSGLKGPTLPAVGGSSSASPYGFPTPAPLPGSLGGPSTAPAPNMSTNNGPVYAANAAAPAMSSIVPKRPAVPVIPSTTPAVQQAQPAQNASAGSGAVITTPSGAQVNQYTGALVQPPPVQPYTGSGSNPAPVLPTLPPAPTGPGSGSISSLDPSTNPLTSSPALQAAMRGIQQYSQMTPEELQATQGLNTLNSSFAKSYADTAGQAIPLPYITGEQAQIQREQAAAAVPLQATITTQEAQRQMGLSGSTALGTIATGQLSALAGLNTKTPLPFGASTYTPATGAIGSGGPFGTSGGASSSTPPIQGSAFDPNNAIDQMVQSYMNTGSMPSNIASMPQYAAAITSRANDLSMQQTGQPFNAAARASGLTTDTSSLGNLQTQYDQANTSLGTVKANGKLLLDGLTAAGLNTAGIPAVNAIQQAVAKGVVAPGDQAAFVNSLNTLQSEYAKMLMGTGVPTDQATARAQAALPANLSAADLAKVLDRMVGEGTNAIASTKTNIDAIKKRINPYNFSSSAPASSTTNLGTGGSASSNPFSAANFFGTSS